MDVGDGGMLEWCFKGLVSIMLTVCGWMLVMLVKAVDKNRDEIASHRLHVADNYVKKDVIERIHTRIDEMGVNIGDIKTLIITTVNGGHK
jgi:hypothetical protein